MNHAKRSGLKVKKTTLLDKIIAYEAGELDEPRTVELFQELIDTGLAWQLQGSYGRTAQALIKAGVCHR